MSREFWIRDQHLNFGPDIKGSKFIAFESNDVEGKDIIHVREVDPKREEVILLMVEALEMGAFHHKACQANYYDKDGITARPCTCSNQKVKHALQEWEKLK